VGTIENLLKEDAASRARLQAALSAAHGLTVPERKKLLVELVTLVESEEESGARRVKVPDDVEPDATFVTKCEAILAAHPEGLTTAEIALAIGQTTPCADATVRWLKKKAPGHVIRRGDRWHLLRPTQKRPQLREYIREALTSAGRPLGSGDILRAVRHLKSDVNKGSVNSELIRMQKASCLFTAGMTKHGTKLYSLAPLSDGGERAK
jgi:hypothetical protein